MTIPWGAPPEPPKYEPPEGYKLVKIKPLYQRSVFWVPVVAVLAVIGMATAQALPKGSEADTAASGSPPTTATVTETATSTVVNTVRDTTTILATASPSSESSKSKTSVPESAGSNSRSNPARTGAPGHFGDDWTVSFGAADLDAWPEIHKASMFADAPTDGEVYISAPVTVTYNGEGSEDAGYNLRYAFVGSKGNVFDQIDHDCGIGGPSGFIDVGELFSGATGSGTVCASVPKDQVQGGVWRVQYTDLETFDQIEGFFALS